MKKSLTILGNVAIILAILAFVMLYVGGEQQRIAASKTEAFENMTVAMESVTTNYLLGEQQVCNSWAGYINANTMTPEEAIAFVRKSVSTPGVMAHLLMDGPSGLSGLSTVARGGDEPDYTVSYKNVDIFSNGLGSTCWKTAR